MVCCDARLPTPIAVDHRIPFFSECLDALSPWKEQPCPLTIKNEARAGSTRAVV